MRENQHISVVIPALNEEHAIGQVLDAIPHWVDEVIVADNGSSDRTAAVARERGARVVSEPRRGYGRACLSGLTVLSRTDIVVFLDADFSDHPDEMDSLVDPILRNESDLVIGSRLKGACEPGALTPQARFGNRLACGLIRLFWGVRFSDLGPFRAIRHSTLQQLHMQDADFGWTVEMQVKAAIESVRTSEVPVSYRCRIGTSKISGTVRGVILAGTKILATIFREALRPKGSRTPPAAERVILFARYPVPGKAKTRLIPEVGPEVAARLHRRMTENAVGVARETGAAVTVSHTGARPRLFRAWLGPEIAYARQSRNDLGGRMREAFDVAFQKGAVRVLAVGSDVPGISPEILRSAFDALRDHDVVLGPATDGGYYLIGMKRLVPDLFSGMDWGTDCVFQQTTEAIQRLGLTLAQLPQLNDVDRPEDLAVLRTISVIVPTLNEAEELAPTLARARQAEGIELIVADGGSRDATREIAQQGGAVVMEVAGGRSAQLNAGAAKSAGRILLFLHADTLLPTGYADAIRQTLDDPSVAAGAFRFKLDGEKTSLRVVEWGTNIRSSLFRWPYGDQGLFMEKRVFDTLGGFASMPIMEDWDLVHRLRQRGQVLIRPEPVITSSRRWKSLGAFQTTLRNQCMIVAYHLGVDPRHLARFYRQDVDPEE